jgi:hypothetical protein
MNLVSIFENYYGASAVKPILSMPICMNKLVIKKERVDLCDLLAKLQRLYLFLYWFIVHRTYRKLYNTGSMGIHEQHIYSQAWAWGFVITGRDVWKFEYKTWTWTWKLEVVFVTFYNANTLVLPWNYSQIKEHGISSQDKVFFSKCII